MYMSLTALLHKSAEEDPELKFRHGYLVSVSSCKW